MALSELLFVADLLTKDAEAKDASKYRPAQVVDMAAECTPEPASVGSSVFFPALDANQGAFNSAVGNIMGKELTRKEAARLVADALLGKVQGQVTASDVGTQTTALDDLYAQTNAASPSEVQSAREDVGTLRTTMAREAAYLSLLVDPKKNRPVTVDTILAETGLTPEAVSMILRRHSLAAYAETFRAQTGWDCSGALDYTAVNGQFPTMGTDLNMEAPKPTEVPVTIPSFAYDTTAKPTYGENRGSFVQEYKAAVPQAEALEDQLAVVPRFARRYKADGTDPVVNLKLVPQVDSKKEE